MPLGAWLEQNSFAVEISPAVEVSRQRPGLFQGRQVFIEGRQASLAAMGEINEVLIGRLIANELAQASFAAANRAGDRVQFAEALLGGLGRGVEPSQRGRCLLEQVGDLDGSLGGDRVELGQGRCIGPAGGQLDDLGADQPFGDDSGHGVGTDQVPEPCIDPQDQLDRLARLAGRDDRLDHAGVDPLDADAMPDLQAGDRLEPGSHTKRRLHLPLPAGHLVQPETPKARTATAKPTFASTRHRPMSLRMRVAPRASESTCYIVCQPMASDRSGCKGP